jgi:NitT/TauT family transport system ATP-binding protein
LSSITATFTANPATAEGREPAVVVRGVTKHFGARGGPTLVLDDVSFDVLEGDLVTLLGASGCGKTTLLRIIAGLVEPSSGEVVVGNRTVQAPRRDLCMVFQNFGLLPWRTVLENVCFALELDKRPRRQREEIAQAQIELVGLKGFEHHYPHELSGGMQQRVGIARALTRRPSVLLMDEPFAALDAQTRETLQEDFLKVWKQLKTTVVFVTHSIDEALVMSDRIVILSTRPGRLYRVVESPFRDRLERDVRIDPEFGVLRHEIRQMLKSMG